MYPPIFEVCKADNNVLSNLGNLPRIYPFGEATDPALPYVVWQSVGGAPENYVNNVPDIDSWSLQIDVYGSTAAEARDAAKAIRDAIEPHCYIVSWS